MITDEYRVDGGVAIVTGSGRGIGKAIALALAEAGADITLVARTKEQIDTTAEEIRKMGRKALAIATDVTKQEQVRKVVDDTVTYFRRIDILCNNAGIFMNKPIINTGGAELQGVAAYELSEEALTLEDWHKVIRTNLTSAFLFSQAVGPHMMKQKKGKVINVSSSSGDEGTPLISAYCVSKAGLNSFTRCLASEWAPFSINVNAIAPGIIDTGMSAPFLKDAEVAKALIKPIPLARAGNPEEVARLALFLASAASDYITGQIFTIDGGGMGQGRDV
jgi:2-deoxy-D-gluconate 3-dehydrogenase